MTVLMVARAEPGDQGSLNLPPRKGHLAADSQVCNCAAHDEKSRDDVRSRGGVHEENGALWRLLPERRAKPKV
jgi:hypothetical protein